VSHVILRFI